MYLLLALHCEQEGTNISREKRKLDHINLALKSAWSPGTNGFQDVALVYEALPELSMEEIDTSLPLFKKKLKAPLLINAMTGGHPDVKAINKSLARAARRYGIAMAVGSQRAGLDNPQVRDTYIIAREENPEGLLLANLSAASSPEMALAAIEMIKADGIQLHLNSAQELAMPEGDRDFREILQNIVKVVKASPVPVIVKEVGYGLGQDTARRLSRAGVTCLDIGGSGGTDFVRIENMRAERVRAPKEAQGLTSAVSLLEVLNQNISGTIIASGGFTEPFEIASALALGAQMIGMAGHLLRCLMESEEALNERIEEIITGLRRAMLMAGARTLIDLPSKPVVITGMTAEWLQTRGINIDQYARR